MLKDNPEIVEQINAIYSQICHINRQYQFFHALFEKNHERNFDVMNKLTKKLFIELQWALLDSIFAGISRLLDDSKVGPYEVLSLKRLISLIEESDESNLHRILDHIKNRLSSNAKAIIKTRHNLLSHNNLQMTLGKKPFPGVIPSQLGLSIAGLWNFAIQIREAIGELHSHLEIERQEAKEQAKLIIHVIDVANNQILQNCQQPFPIK